MGKTVEMMKKLFLFTAVCVFAIFALTANGADPVPLARTADGKAILTLIQANLKASREKDLKTYMDQLALPENESDPTRKEVGLQVAQLFRMYTLDYRLEKARIIKIDGDDAQVEVVLVTRLIVKLDSAPPYRDNRVSAIHALKKIGGRWKFAALKIQKVEFLDEVNQRKSKEGKE